MRFFPNSGAGPRPRVVREFNPCHDSKTGMFSSKGEGDCEPGDWADPGRQRSIYGQMAEGSLDLSRDELRKAKEWVDGTDDKNERVSAKKQIAEALGAELEKHPDFDKFYREYSSQMPTYGGATHGGDGDGEYDWDEDPYGLKSQYKGEYEEYEEQAREDIDNEAYEEQRNEWDKERGLAIESATVAVRKVRELWEEVQAESPYGDVSNHPRLPEMGDPEERGEFDPVAFIGEHVIGEEAISGAVQKTVSNAKHWESYEWEREVGDGVDWDDPEFREELKDRLREESTRYPKDKTRLGAHGEKRKGDAAIGEQIVEEFSRTYDPDHFEMNYDNVDYSDIKNFESWYEDEYGKPDPPENDDEDDDGYGPTFPKEGASSRGNRTAAWLVHKWAETSGDGDAMSVAMQEAANREFKLGATYAGVFTNRSASPHVVKDHLQHAPFMQHFLRTMYNHTQKKLKDAGIEYVTLYRGYTIADEANEKGLRSSVNRAGDFVDVLMQPMSSTTPDFDIASRFSSRSKEGAYIGFRVPRSRIIGTARTGYGALNESEFVVLGGRTPAYFVQPFTPEGKAANTTPGGSTFYSPREAFWSGYERAKRRYHSPRTAGGVVVGPGDRL